MNCLKCGSNNIETGVEWGASGFDVKIGLKRKKGILNQIEQVYSDLCLDCGNINDMYIKDNTNKKENI